MKRFYLAASYKTQIEAGELADAIEAATAREWTCSSRWIREDYSEVPFRICAEHDLADIRSSQAFIMNLGPSFSRGKYTEFGYALAGTPYILPILLIGTEYDKKKNSVFFHLDSNVTWAPLYAGAYYAASWLCSLT